MGRVSASTRATVRRRTTPATGTSTSAREPTVLWTWSPTGSSTAAGRLSPTSPMATTGRVGTGDVRATAKRRGGRCADFIGSNSEINVPPADFDFDSGANTSFSIEYWMMTPVGSTCPGNQVVVGRDDAVSTLHWWSGCGAGGVPAFWAISTAPGAGSAVGPPTSLTVAGTTSGECTTMGRIACTSIWTGSWSRSLTPLTTRRALTQSQRSTSAFSIITTARAFTSTARSTRWRSTIVRSTPARSRRTTPMVRTDRLLRHLPADMFGYLPLDDPEWALLGSSRCARRYVRRRLACPTATDSGKVGGAQSFIGGQHGDRHPRPYRLRLRRRLQLQCRVLGGDASSSTCPGNDVIVGRDDFVPRGASLHWWSGCLKDSGTPAFIAVAPRMGHWTNRRGFGIHAYVNDGNWHHIVAVLDDPANAPAMCTWTETRVGATASNDYTGDVTRRPMRSTSATSI